ncbi:MAG: DUF2490 domain-containing protein [Chitinophagaceae bacterium]|nr:DUF2490 domain-containing protein [Chitinophagaceae bacterium]
MYRRNFWLLLCSLLAAAGATAQTNALGTWNVVNLRYVASDKWSFFGEAQLRSLRFYNHFHYYEYKGGVNFKLHKNVKLSLAAGSYQTYAEGGNFKTPKNNDEFRLWPQLIILHDVSRLKFEHRYRMEMRWTSNGYRNRFRYRLACSYPFGRAKDGQSPFSASVSNELFFTDNAPYFERNRLQATLSWKATRQSTIQAGYLSQFDYRINDETGRNFLVLGFYHELTGKKRSKTSAVDTDLKDN